MSLPEFGGEFDSLDDDEVDAARRLTGLQSSVPVDSFWLFRTNVGVTLYAKPPDGWAQAEAKAAALKELPLPGYFVIDANTPLPESVPLSYLTATAKSKQARPRRKVLGWLEKLLDNPDWFATSEGLEKAKPQLVDAHSKLNHTDEDDDQHPSSAPRVGGEAPTRGGRDRR
jgi:hypothetical protein